MFLLIFLLAGLAFGDPTVSLRQGTIVGTTTSLPSATQIVNQYLGIPFAVSPPRRFEPPVALGSSTAVILAQQWKPKCIETVTFPPLTDNAPQSEDCLYLNVYTPAGSEGTSTRAVMFWIYGGGLQFGNAGQPFYDGSSFAANQDVVIVTINYRTNIFGFSNAPGLPLASRNAGFYDQRLALQWVQDNIAAFGGDPNRVTIFGESSGASSVDRLLTSPPQGRLPYHAAILQSGQATVSLSGSISGESQWMKVANTVGCTGGDVSCMQAVDYRLIEAAVRNASYAFQPVNDDITQEATPLFFPRTFGQAANVPMLIGTNSDEGALVVAAITTSTSLTDGSAIDAIVNATVPGLYPIAHALLDPLQDAGLAVIFKALSRLVTDLIYTCPASLVSKASSFARNPTWRYLFSASFPDTQSFIKYEPVKDVGAFHTTEIPLVFGTYPALSFSAPATAQEVALSKYMQTAWANFAKSPQEGPGWTSLGQNLDYVGCLGCSGAPNGVSPTSAAFTDLSCGLFNVLYVANKPQF